MHYTVEAIQDHSKTLVAKLVGIDDRDTAYALRGQEISVARSDLPPPEENEFYWSDLIGLTAVNREGVELGKVDSLMETGAHDVLVVKGTREHLIPFVAHFVGKVDRGGRDDRGGLGRRLLMRFDAVTLFPEMFDAVLDYGITRRALDRGLYRFKSWNPRDFTDDPHRTVDDRPYGGGPGMLMQAEPLDRALNAVQQDLASENLTPWVVHFSPRGRPLTHQRVMELKDKPAAGFVVRAVRRHRRAVVAAPRGRRTFAGRLCVVGRRTPRAGIDGCDHPATAGRVERCRFGGGRFLRQRPARLPALHPARSLAGDGGAGSIERRQPRRDRPVAIAAKPDDHGRPIAPICWPSGGCRSRNRILLAAHPPGAPQNKAAPVIPGQCETA